MRDELYFANLCRKVAAVFLKDQWFHLGYSRIEPPTDEVVIVTVTQLSTRGTVGSDNWLMRLAEKLVPRSYHL